MAYWVLKTEPGDYAFDDLVRDGKTLWEGVTNALAVKHLKSMKKGDRVLLYHTGKQKALVGLATIAAADGGMVTLQAGKPLPRPVALSEIKLHPELAAWGLVRIGRLSVVPTTAAQWQTVMALAGA